MRFSEAHGRKVVSTSTADTVGKVEQFVVDAPAGKVAGVTLKKTRAGGDLLPWGNIAAFGVDAVTVKDEAAVVIAEGRAKDLQDKRFAVLGKRVLTQAGVEVGVVKDVDFDPADGTVRALLTDREELGGDRLVDVGSYAVIVTAVS